MSNPTWHALVITDADLRAQLDPKGPHTVGEVYAYGTGDPPAAEVLAAKGLEAVVVDHPPSAGEAWDPETQAVVAVEAPPRPDPNGFLLAAMGALGLERGNALLAAWPTFTVALGAGNWGVARLVIDAATTAETVTSGERDTLVALLDQHGIPEA